MCMCWAALMLWLGKPGEKGSNQPSVRQCQEPTQSLGQGGGVRICYAFTVICRFMKKWIAPPIGPILSPVEDLALAAEAWHAWHA